MSNGQVQSDLSQNEGYNFLLVSNCISENGFDFRRSSAVTVCSFGTLASWYTISANAEYEKCNE